MDSREKHAHQPVQDEINGLTLLLSLYICIFLTRGHLEALELFGGDVLTFEVHSICLIGHAGILSSHHSISIDVEPRGAFNLKLLQWLLIASDSRWDICCSIFAFLVIVAFFNHCRLRKISSHKGNAFNLM